MPIVLKSGNLKYLEPSGPVQVCNGVAFMMMMMMIIIIIIIIISFYFENYDMMLKIN